MDVEREIRKLKRWNAVCVTTLILIVGWMAGARVIESFRESMRTLEYSRDGDVLRLSASTDGPFVVTHISVEGYPEPGKLWAALPEPLAIIDSHGGYVDLSKLNWYDYMGEPANPPGSQTPLEALYFVPKFAEKREPY